METQMTTNPAHLDDAPEAANQPAPAAQSSAIALRPSLELAVEFPALNQALVFLGEEPLEVSAPAPAMPAKRAPRRRRRKAPRPVRASRASKRIIARPPEPETPLERHERKCLVCHHPERETIEDMFVHWHQPFRMAHDYDLPLRSLYRHAHATGLLAARRRNLRCVLDHILERATSIHITSDSIVRAVRAYTCLTDDNKWVEPATHVIVSPGSPPPPPRNSPKSNRHLAIRK
jgi:hypothetical protein